MSRRLRNMAAQREALRRSVEDFGDKGLSEPNWETVFSSPDPDDVNLTMQVVGCYEHLVGNLAELARGGARMTGLADGRRPRAEECFTALEQDGVFTSRQRATLDQLYVFCGRLGHASPNVAADEVALHVKIALRQVPTLTKALVAWLAERGIEIA